MATVICSNKRSQTVLKSAPHSKNTIHDCQNATLFLENCLSDYVNINPSFQLQRYASLKSIELHNKIINFQNCQPTQRVDPLQETDFQVSTMLNLHLTFISKDLWITAPLLQPHSLFLFNARIQVIEETYASHAEHVISPKLSLTYMLHIKQTLQPAIKTNYASRFAA